MEDHGRLTCASRPILPSRLKGIGDVWVLLLMLHVLVLHVLAYGALYCAHKQHPAHILSSTLAITGCTVSSSSTLAAMSVVHMACANVVHVEPPPTTLVPTRRATHKTARGMPSGLQLVHQQHHQSNQSILVIHITNSSHHSCRALRCTPLPIGVQRHLSRWGIDTIASCFPSHQSNHQSSLGASSGLIHTHISAMYVT